MLISINERTQPHDRVRVFTRARVRKRQQRCRQRQQAPPSLEGGVGAVPPVCRGLFSTPRPKLKLLLSGILFVFFRIGDE